MKVVLPRVAARKRRIRHTTGSVELRGTETVLLVEDEEAVRDLVQRILKTAGYAVHTACHGGEALATCEQLGAEIHLLLTDVVMPHGLGTDLAKTLQNERPGISVLFMSGYTRERIEMDVRAVSFVAKPFTPEVLDAHIRKVLDITDAVSAKSAAGPTMPAA